MKITDEGSELVQSLEFAQGLRMLLDLFHINGRAEEEGIACAVTAIAWAASGQPMNSQPTGQELIDLENFVNSNASTINALAGKCLDNLVKVDTGAIVH
jgi:hypothetical protein